MKSLYRKYEQVTTTMVMSMIKELISRQPTRNTISVDSLAMLFHLNPPEMLPIIEELEDTGYIQRVVPVTTSNRSSSLGAVRLPQLPDNEPKPAVAS